MRFSNLSSLFSNLNPFPSKKRGTESHNVETRVLPDIKASPHPKYLAPLISKLKYLSAPELHMVKVAYSFADNAHYGQMRSSGEPYITHPVEAAIICADWKLDCDAIMAALLHDVIEDQQVSKESIATEINPTVADLVDGLTKLERIQFASKAEQQAESFRKMLLATTKDVRVILIKLADRLHNMRTLSGLEPSKARRIAKETLEIYAAIANRLGFTKLVAEFEDLAFSINYPKRYKVLKNSIETERKSNRKIEKTIHNNIVKAIPADAKFGWTSFSTYKVHEMMKSQNKSFSNLNDTKFIDITVPKLQDAYVVLGALHQIYRPVPGTFEDYIAIPKVNGYRALHTIMVGPVGTHIDVAIYTESMKAYNEYGIIAHWLNRDQELGVVNVDDQSHNWLQSLVEIQSINKNSEEFIDDIKIDLFPDSVYALTPKGKIISLPSKATALDFEFAIHTDIGLHAVSGTVNGEHVPINHVLASGDTVDIISNPATEPNVGWLNYAKTGRARAAIRYFLKNTRSKESTELGRKLLLQALDELKLTLPNPTDTKWQKILQESGASSIEEILMDIGIGNRIASVVARRFMVDNPIIHTSVNDYDSTESAKRTDLIIKGNEGQAIQYAKCCTPLHGDPIVGVLHPGSGLIVHHKHCTSVDTKKALEQNKFVNVAWDTKSEASFKSRVQISVMNGKGVLGAIALEASKHDSNISNLSMIDEDSDSASINITLQLENLAQLRNIISDIRRIPEVMSVVRPNLSKTID